MNSAATLRVFQDAVLTPGLAGSLRAARDVGCELVASLSETCVGPYDSAGVSESCPGNMQRVRCFPFIVFRLRRTAAFIFRHQIRVK